MEGTFFSGALILCSERIAHFQKGVDSACLDHFGTIHSKKDGTLNFFQMCIFGDDATENDNFQRGKQRLQGRKNLNFIFISSW